jgi:hypothetical protein
MSKIREISSKTLRPNYWVLGLYPSSGVLKTRKQRFGNWMCFRQQVRGETPTVLGPLESVSLSHWIEVSSF